MSCPPSPSNPLARCGRQVGKGMLGDMLYSLYFKGTIAPTVIPGTHLGGSLLYESMPSTL